MKCPACAEDVQDDALKCRFCGKWIKDNPDFKSIFDEGTGDQKAQLLAESVVYTFFRDIPFLVLCFIAIFPPFFLPKWITPVGGFAFFCFEIYLLHFFFYKLGGRLEALDKKLNPPAVESGGQDVAKGA